MNESQLQSEHLSGHVLPGIAYIILSVALWYIVVIEDTIIKGCKGMELRLSQLTGIVLILIGFICWCLWMADLGAGKTNTKIHRILSMMVIPLGASMLAPPYDPLKYSEYQRLDESLTHTRYIPDSMCLWRDFLPLYCMMNTFMYLGHRHPGQDMEMPNGEEDAHSPLMWSFGFATVVFGLGQYLAILRDQLFLHIVGCGCFFVIGVWYCVIAGVLYNGTFGINGERYEDSTADFGIVVFSTTTFFIALWSVYTRCKKKTPPTVSEIAKNI